MAHDPTFDSHLVLLQQFDDPGLVELDQFVVKPHRCVIPPVDDVLLCVQSKINIDSLLKKVHIHNKFFL